MDTKDKQELLYYYSTFTKKDLLKKCNSIIEFSSSREDKEEIDFLAKALILPLKKEDVYRYYIKTLIAWYCFIHIYSEKEDYELCNIVNKCIQIENEEMEDVLKTVFSFTKNDVISLKYINDTYKKEFVC